MKKLSFISALFVVASVVFSLFSCTAQTPKASLKTEIDSLSYAFGVTYTQGIDGFFTQQGVDADYLQDFIAGFNEGTKIDKDSKEAKKIMARLLGQQVGSNMSSSIESMSLEVFGGDTTKTLNKANLLAGFVDGVLDKNFAIPREESQVYFNSALERVKEEVMGKQYATEKAENLKYLEDNKSKEGVVTLPSGLQYKVVKEGKGPKPSATDNVKVNYIGTTIDGNEFDSSIKRGAPAEFPLNGVIKGWTEGIQLMPVGSKYIFYIPYKLAYGLEGSGPIPPFATLIFDVDLLDITTTPAE